MSLLSNELAHLQLPKIYFLKNLITHEEWCFISDAHMVVVVFLNPLLPNKISKIEQKELEPFWNPQFHWVGNAEVLLLCDSSTIIRGPWQRVKGSSTICRPYFTKWKTSLDPCTVVCEPKGLLIPFPWKSFMFTSSQQAPGIPYKWAPEAPGTP